MPMMLILNKKPEKLLSLTVGNDVNRKDITTTLNGNGEKITYTASLENGSEDSLGFRLKNAYGLDPKIRSLIRAVLVNDGLITSKDKKPIFLKPHKLGSIDA